MGHCRVLGTGTQHCTLALRAVSTSRPDTKQRRRENFVGRQPSVLGFCNASPAGSEPPDVYSFAPVRGSRKLWACGASQLSGWSHTICLL